LGWIEGAKISGCDKLLISSEGLFHSLASNEYYELFEELKKKTVISEINSLVFLREPFDHIISLYKHRGKRGTITDFKSWVENDYETLDMTEILIDKAKSDKIAWTYRKYKNDSKFMAESLFSDWLKIETPRIPSNDKVNTSLTLSEILVLRELNKSGEKEEVLWLQKQFALITKENKASDSYLKNFYRAQIDEWIKSKSKVMAKTNINLRENEKLFFIDSVYDLFKENVNLSSYQLAKIIQLREINNNYFSKIYSKIKQKLIQ
jgi:hypothetical protein